MNAPQSNSDTTFHDHPGSDQPHQHEHHARGTDREDETLQLREEELQARTREVETGRVQLGKNVVEEERTLEVPVTRDEVTIERRPVDRRPADGPISDDDDATIRVAVHEERVEVEKTPVVYEEVAIGKREVTTTQPVSETVRREEVHVETEGDTHPHRDL